MKTSILALGAALLSCAAAADFDVTRYGAKPDGATDNTAAIQKAIDACSAKGGGRVVVPGGGVYRTIYFVPNLLGGLALGYIWQFIFEILFTQILFGKNSFDNV